VQKINWKNHLNEFQYDAVSDTDGPMLVIAGAGSGKTRVLTYRVAYLIQEKGISPETIIAITFTNKAAGAMKERIIDLCGKRKFHPWVATFHRTCAEFLRNYGSSAGLPDKFTVFDDSEQEVVMKRVLKKLHLDPKQNPPKSMLYRISRAKSHLITPEIYTEQANNTFENTTAKVYEAYQKELREQNAYDFDDLITETCLMLENHKPTRELLQGYYNYLLVDEFQDINQAQYHLIKHLTNPKTKNVFVVGDDDQSIYGWRYADPEFIYKYQKDFAPVKIVKLEDNYRSTHPVLQVANEVIRMKSWGITKVLRTNRTGDELPRFYYAQSEMDEAYYVAQTIKEAVDNGADYSDFAVLYRMNAQSRSFEEVFGRFAIPYQVIGGLRFYQRMEIKDILGYFRVLVNDRDRASLSRIINVPKRGIGDVSQEKILNLMEKYDLGLFGLAENKSKAVLNELPDSVGRHLKQFLDLMLAFRQKSTELSHVELLEWILDKTGYEKQLLIENTIESLARHENLQELKGAFASFQDDYPDEGIDIFLDQVSLKADVDSYEDKKNLVTMMTLHSAKGLEFKNVFIPGVEEDFLPHSRSKDSPSELDEERRLFYVGITRAEDNLFITCARSRYWRGTNMPKSPSRFLNDIPRDLVSGLDVIDDDFRMIAAEMESYGGWSGRLKKKRLAKSEDDDFEVRDYDVMPSDEFPESPKKQKQKKRAVLDIKSKYKIGDIVSHPKFGIGEVVQIDFSGDDDNFISVAFDVGVKILSERAAPLSKAEK
jgi:DNA helicase-2/ATP-dependent DNA helicase PcrA